MKRFATFVLIVLLVIVARATEVQARPAFIANIDNVCVVVQMDCSYTSRYDLIDLVYDATGKVMFNKESNPYTRGAKEDAEVIRMLKRPRYYIGTAEQNAKLARNIMANEHLFVKGKLTVAGVRTPVHSLVAPRVARLYAGDFLLYKGS